ncbi:DUF5694 domain-containing protein [Sphingomonas sp. dw_22]|uniref:DUF5694 domain-containing protein n=1 Tax=Sphingomonas sp. dw_22 TaxID=2721175 RepID=UPI001BD653BE|nr:DUF5694 domain-containing protein [Sphingomonas sp. dw_22]
MNIFKALVAGCLLLATPPAMAQDKPAEPIIQVMVVGVFHFDNPGKDYRNASVDDMLAPARQAEIVKVAAALSAFKPTLVGVEWEPGAPDADYKKYLADALPADRSEIVQLGFRVARANGLARVHGLDMPMSLPFDPAVAFATAHGHQAVIDDITKVSDANVAAQEKTLREKGVAATLRLLNDSAAALRSHGLYREILELGAGKEQPGLDATLAWYKRNLGICANLLQAARPGDRVIVFFGAGHLPLLQQCVSETPGYVLVDARTYLPND